MRLEIDKFSLRGMKMKIGLLFLFIGIAISANAQKERKFIREGNKLFETQDFEKAEVEYRKAMDKKAESFEAGFNLGDALYKQKKYEEALQQFSSLVKGEKDKERLGELYHNMGNTLLSLGKTDESIEAYKESLRNRPASAETKYNLEFARHKKQQDQQEQDQQEQDQQDQQDQNKDKDKDKDQNKDQQNQQGQDKNQQNQDQQDQNQEQQDKNQQEQDKDKEQQNQEQQDQNKDENQQPESQQQEGKISKEDAARLLEALQGDEKKVQEKVQKQKAQEQKSKKMKIEKDW